MGSNWGRFRRCWWGAIGILIMFRLMLPASYGQSSLYVLVLMESPQRLFIVRSYSSCLDKVQQSNSLKENSPLMLTFPLCSFPCLKPCLFRFHQCEEHERRAVYKVNITSFFVENPSYPHYSRLGRHIWIQVKAFKYFRDVDPYGMIVLVSAGTELTLFLVAGTVLCFGFSVRMMLITHWCFSCC